MSDLLKMEYPREHVALITLNDPSHMNAFSGEMIAALTQAIENVNASDDIYAAVITGSGKAFVAGADIKYMQTLSPEGGIAYSKNTTHMYDMMEASHKIFIAAVNGYALGAGFELTLSCDLRIGSNYARFGLPETGLGIIPGGHGTKKLPDVIGTARAKELIFLGRTIKADEAYGMGLINRVSTAESLIDDALKMAEDIAKGAVTAIGYAKEAINMSRILDERSAYAYEEKLFGLCFAAAEQTEGMAAFVERRKPDFSVGR